MDQRPGSFSGQPGEAKRETKRRPPPAGQPVKACWPAYWLRNGPISGLAVAGPFGGKNICCWLSWVFTWSPTKELAQVSRPPETSRTAARASPKLVSRASKVLRRIVIHFRESRPASIHAGLNGRDYPTRRLNFGDGPHDRQVATMDSSWLRARTQSSAATRRSSAIRWQVQVGRWRRGIARVLDHALGAPAQGGGQRALSSTTERMPARICTDAPPSQRRAATPAPAMRAR